MATQLNNWLSIDKISGTGNAEITITASSYEELVDRTTSLKIQGISANAILNVRQNAFVPSATLDSYEITAYRAGTYTNGITSNVPWTAVVNGDWITIDKTQGESGYTTLSITLDAHTETRNGSIIFNAEGVVLTLQIYQIYDLKKTYFCIEFEETEGEIWNLTKSPYADIYHSFDGITWEKSPKILSMGNNRLVYLKNNKRIISDGYGPNNLNIQFNKNAKVGGDFSSMTVMDFGCCSGLFLGNEYLTDASELILPWETLDSACYENMFQGCTRLIAAPALPATTLALSCYQHMFEDCTSLTTAPALPATTLAKVCYNSMFTDCTSLTTAPELPATTLTGGCYEYMFQGCTSLTTAPELPATTLAESCYCQMFYACESLTIAPELPATTLDDYCYKHMFNRCISLVNPPSILPATTLVNECYYNMFYGCTSLTTAPELPATTLVNNCYQNMFYGCTSLVNTPSILPATTLTEYCYSHMFDGCTSLTTAPELPATTLAGYCYQGMFYGCTNLTTAPELPATTLAGYCYHDMFYGCTSLVNAPSIIPATTLAEYSCQYMFYGCTSLTIAPALPATTLSRYCCQYMFGYCTNLTTAPELLAAFLPTYCYRSMFYNCTNLNYIKMLATNVSATNALLSWVNGVSSTGTFIKHPDADLKTGTSGIPSGWTVETATQ